MKNYNLASIILRSDELKDIQNEINESETKKKELERKIRISDMVSQFIKQILSEGKPVKDGKDWVIKAEVEDNFCYCTKRCNRRSVTFRTASSIYSVYANDLTF